MPITGSKATDAGKSVDGSAPNATGRTTFRPPWVKEGPKTETVPWSKRNTPAPLPAANGATKEVKLQSREIKVPVSITRKPSIPTEPLVKPKPKEVAKAKTPEPEEGSSSEYEEVTDSEEETESEEESEEEAKAAPIQVKLKPVAKPPLAEVKKSPSVDRAGKFVKPALKKVPTLEKVYQLDQKQKPKPPPPTIPEKKVLRTVEKPAGFKEPANVEQKDVVRPPLRKQESTTKKPSIPAPPPPPKMVPPPPPPPGTKAPADFVKKPITEKHKETLEKLKSRPRRRPDWSDMMKEVEQGRKLKHVECNDRSKPILKSETITNINNQFVYESEKATAHNALLKQIQGGLKLKPTKTNDRSKPILEGLRKFRRQMTIEEQIQKSESKAQLGQLANKDDPLEDSADEMDDIDKLRDDLQSTKQMLALELRNKEAQERENKRLLAKIQQLEAELSSAKSAPSENTESKSSSNSGDNDALIKSLKAEANDAQTTSKLLEKKYQDAAEQLDTAKGEIEDQKRKIADLEKKLAQGSGAAVPNSRRQSEAQTRESSPEPDFESSGAEEEEVDEEKKAARLIRRLAREVKWMSGKLIRLKEKQQAARKERLNIRDLMKKNQVVLKQEKKKYKKLQREVDKMAALMKDDDDEDENDEEPKEEEEPAENEEESEIEESEESEESESEPEEESASESEAEDASDDKKKTNYEPRIKRHEGRLAALKKGNLLRQANLDRLIDEINRIRDESVTLQHDLDSVLSELG